MQNWPNEVKILKLSTIIAEIDLNPVRLIATTTRIPSRFTSRKYGKLEISYHCHIKCFLKTSMAKVGFALSSVDFLHFRVGLFGGGQFF